MEDNTYEQPLPGMKVEHLYDKPHLVSSQHVYNTTYDENFSSGQPINLNIYPASKSSPKTKYWIIGGVIIGVLLIIATVSITLLVVQQEDSSQPSTESPVLSTLSPSTSSPPTVLPTTSVLQSGEWQPWSLWGECSVSCGQGFRTRTRECSGTGCNGLSTDNVSEECMDEVCLDPMDKYGTWSTWNPWLPCSQSCREGTQKRTRDCNKDVEQEYCLGEADIVRPCNNGACLEDVCDNQCDGTLLENCTCICSGESVSGTILTENGEPISNVIVSHAEVAGLTYAVSGEDGTYTISNVCPNTPLKFHKEGFVTESENSWARTKNTPVVLTRFVRLAIQRESRGGARLVGGCITFKCDVAGTPEPNNYEWYKNRNMTTMKSQTWTITSVTEQDSGLYYCRASNDENSVFTHGYTLKVRNSSNEFCWENPLSIEKPLPAGCLLNGENFIEDRRCFRTACSTGNETCEEKTKSTCGATKYERQTVTCTNFSFDVFVPKECGCIPWKEPMYRVRGVIVSAETLSPVRAASVLINDTEVTTTDNGGEFFIEGKIESPRLVLTIDDPRDIYAQLVTVIEVSEDNADMQYVVLKVPERLLPVEVESSKTITLHPGNSKFSTGFANITIPPNSLYNTDGTLYDGKANIIVEQYDPRNTASISSAPGDFSSVDIEGDDSMLLSSGMFRLDIEDANGNDLNLAGKVRVAFDAPIDNTYHDGEISPTKLWSLNSVTGKWEFLSDMTLEDDYRTSTKNASRMPGVTDWGKYYSELDGISIRTTWTNFDSISEVTCHSKIRVFDREGFWNSVQLEGAKISVLILENGHSRITGNTVSRVRASTDDGDSNGYCVIHPCDSTRSNTHYGMKGYIVADDSDANMLTPDYENRFPEELEYRKRENAIEVNLDFTATPANGPFYDWNGSKWKYSDACSDALNSERHFRFYRKPLGICAVSEYDAKPGGVEGVSDDNYYAWYTGDGYMYIKVLIQDENNYTVQALSMVGENNVDVPLEVGETYGVREDCKESSAVCLEGKVSGIVTDGRLNTEYGDVLTTLNITLVNITGYDVITEQFLSDKYGQDITELDNGVSIKIQDVLAHKYGQHFGIYIRNDKNKARYACRRGNDNDQFSADPPAMTKENWAFKFVFN